jgi:hypothetical protein
LDALRELTSVGEVGGIRAAQSAGVIDDSGLDDNILGLNLVYGRRGVDHFCDGGSSGFPVSADVGDLGPYLVGAVKCKDEIRFRQQGEKRGFVELGAGNMQAFIIAFAKESRELVPCPAAEFRNRSHDFRGARLDPAAMRCNQQTSGDISVTKGDAKVPARNVPLVKHLLVIVRFVQATQDSRSPAAENPGQYTHSPFSTGRACWG